MNFIYKRSSLTSLGQQGLVGFHVFAFHGPPHFIVFGAATPRFPGITTTPADQARMFQFDPAGLRRDCRGNATLRASRLARKFSEARSENDNCLRERHFRRFEDKSEIPGCNANRFEKSSTQGIVVHQTRDSHWMTTLRQMAP